MKYKENLDNDAVLAAAFALAGEMEEEPASNNENVDFSAEHEAKMHKLFAAEYKKQRLKQFKTYASRVAALFVAAVLVAGISVGSVEAWRVRVINFFRETTKEYTEIRFTEEPVSSYSVNGITLNYIPDGYRLVGDYSKIGEYTDLEFQDNTGKTFHFYSNKIDSNSSITFDTEDAEVSEFEKNGYHIIKSIKSDLQVLVWYNDTHKYVLDCGIGEKELLKIAENIDF